ncbi:DNA-binding protein [Gottfriedia acidiceleris]|uniref:DNA-binding protein n=1 Tax=Gottfriedia acidiceleris TaxID=371036 RepID=UPI0030006300
MDYKSKELFDSISEIDKREFIRNEVLLTNEAIEYLGITRARMSAMILKGKIKPIKKTGAISLFLLHDLEEKKKELVDLRIKYRPYEY